MSVKRAAHAYSEFTGHKPSQVRRSRLDDSDVAGWEMGPMVGVAYEARRDGKTQAYFHEFGKKARPRLVSRDDGRQLYIDGGKYKVTDRGIEDMPQLFVVNPSPRRGKVKASRKRARPMAARRRRRTTRRRATRQVAIFRSNPVRRRRRRYTARRRSFARNPILTRRRVRRRRVSARRYRRNPSARAVGGTVAKLFMPAMGIGAGAVGSEIIMGYLPIPANFKQGAARHITKGVVGVAAGMLLGKVFRAKRIGNYFALGAIAIATHDFLKEVIAARMPAIQMGQYRAPIRSSFAGMGYANPGQVARLGQYVSPVASSFGAAARRTTGGETDFAV